MKILSRYLPLIGLVVPTLAIGFGGGRLVLAHRTDSAAPRDFPPPVYRFPSDEEVEAALEAVGLATLELAHRTFGSARVSFRVAGR